MEVKAVALPVEVPVKPVKTPIHVLGVSADTMLTTDNVKLVHSGSLDVLLVQDTNHVLFVKKECTCLLVDVMPVSPLVVPVQVQLLVHPVKVDTCMEQENVIPVVVGSENVLRVQLIIIVIPVEVGITNPVTPVVPPVDLPVPPVLLQPLVNPV